MDARDILVYTYQFQETRGGYSFFHDLFPLLLEWSQHFLTLDSLSTNPEKVQDLEGNERSDFTLHLVHAYLSSSHCRVGCEVLTTGVLLSSFDS
jgi:hypothetical protein